MTDLLLQYGLSNGVLALGLAVAAWAVHASGRRPGLAHVLWLVVLIKLVTPPMVSLPVIDWPRWQAPAAVLTPVDSATAPVSRDTTHQAPAIPIEPGVASASPHAVSEPPPATTPASGQADTATSTASAWAVPWRIIKRALMSVWLLGTLIVLTFTLVRVARFSRVLRRATLPAPPAVQQQAAQVARQLGLKKTPAVYTAAARVSPMVWWAGGAVRVVLPETVAIECVPGRLRWVLAHELAHIKRRDHLVRWVEWLACVMFWWNPIAWWARRNLRLSEEVCCDALVLERFTSPDEPSTSYADAILGVVESLATPALRPPAIASELNPGATLQRRLEMILSPQTLSRTPRWARTAVLLAAVGLTPLGIAQAGEPAPKQQDRGALVERELEAKVQAMMAEIRAAVTSGEITPEEGRRKAQEVRQWIAAMNDQGAHAPHGDGPAHGTRHDRDAAHAHEHAGADDGIEAHLRAIGVDEEGFDAIVAYLTEHGLGRMQLEPTLGGALRIAHGMYEHGDAYEMDERVADYLRGEIGLSNDQIDAVLGLSAKLAAMIAKHHEQAVGDDAVDIRGYFLRLGLDAAGYDSVVATLAEHGVGRVQMEPTLGGLFHTVLAVREYGVEHAMETIDENAFFSRHVGLDAAQIELVGRLAQRLAAIAPHEHRDRPDRRNAVEAPRELERAEREAHERDRLERRERQMREREDRERALDLEHRRQDEARARAEREQAVAAVLARLEAAVAEGAISAQQAEQRLAELQDRLAAQEAVPWPHIHAEPGAPREGKPDVEAIRAELVSAVEAGEITAEQAEARLLRLRRHLIDQVEEALAGQTITREEAREKVEAIRAMTELGE